MATDHRRPKERQWHSLCIRGERKFQLARVSVPVPSADILRVAVNYVYFQFGWKQDYARVRFLFASPFNFGTVEKFHAARVIFKFEGIFCSTLHASFNLVQMNVRRDSFIQNGAVFI